MTPFRIVLIGCVLTLLAVLVLDELVVSFIPQTQAHVFTVTFDYPHHPPRVVEREVTSMLENELSQLEELKKIYSRSRYGNGQIELEFPQESDLAFREMEINMLLRRLLPKLPPECRQPRLSRSSLEDEGRSPMLIYEFTYKGDDVAANTWLNNFLIPRLGAIPKIDKVATTGNIQYAWKIQFDPDRLAKLQLTRQQVIQSLASTYKRTELGLIDTQQGSRTIFVDTGLQNQYDLENFVLYDAIRLSDVAQVEMAPDRVEKYLRINGMKAIFISFYTHEDSNRIAVAKETKQEIGKICSSMPLGYELQLNYDDTAYLRTELSKTQTRALLSVLVIMLFIFVSSFSWRYLLISGSSIIVSLALTTLTAWIFQLSIHLYTLAGLTIAIGILVDNTIILVDHLHKQRNLSVIPAQLTAAITTIIALMVIWLLPLEYRGSLDDFGLIIVITLAASLMVSRFFSPAISRLIGFQSKATQKKKFSKRKRFYRRLNRLKRGLHLGVRYRKITLSGFILLFGLPIFLLPGKWETQGWYDDTIGSDFYQETLKPHINKWLGGSLRLFYQEVYERSGFRSPEKTRLYVKATLPYGHTLDQMNQVIGEVEEYLLQFPEVDKFITGVYGGQYGSVTVEFSAEAERIGFPVQLKSRLIQRSLEWGGVTWSIHGVGKGFSNVNYASLPGFEVMLTGYQYEKLEQIAEELAGKLLKHKRIQEVNTNAQLSWNEASLLLYRFKPNPQRMATPGLEATLQYLSTHSLQQFPSFYLNYKDKVFPVYVESDASQDLSLHTSMHTGHQEIPLRYFGELKKQQTPNALHKVNRQYLRKVNFDFYGSFRFGNKYLDEVIEEMKNRLPPGFKVEKQEWSWDSDAERSRYELILVLLIGIFFISTIFLESIRQGFLVTMIIPFSFIGLFLIFGWGDFSFDQGGYASFLMIGGLSVNALLYILSDYRQFRKKYEPYMAMTLAMSQKAWPILLTVISTCCGLIPFLIHGDDEVFWFSFAVGTIGGLIFSLIVVFVLMPILLLPNASLKLQPLCQRIESDQVHNSSNSESAGECIPHTMNTHVQGKSKEIATWNGQDKESNKCD